MLIGRDLEIDDTEGPTYNLVIKQFEGREERVHLERVIPTLKSKNRNTITYDLACIRFTSPNSGEMLIDSRIGSNRSYFYNILRPLLNHAASLKSCVQLHAALTQWEGVGVLMPGGSGSGKSTLSILSAVQGQKLITDDLSLVGIRNAQLVGRTIRRHFFLRAQTFSYLPLALKAEAVDVVFMGEKKHVVLRENIESMALSDSNINVILFPSISHTRRDYAFKIECISKTTAFLKLFENVDTLAIDMANSKDKSRFVKALQRMVKECVCLSIETTPVLLEKPQEYIAQIIKEVSEHSKRS